ncbi:acetyl-CoA carboxylase alpha subunit-like protein [Chlorobaculum parvum NCIB 8327]|uniref:Acetyl-coenzyme A carboxylase carboxyl transferase subunits beta/alpha n=1 Tax=Chlorobaculum parvum (strain DSM 263 / NCIMB 8327) TaxID=517417 RepID=B3QMU2_CHLP8|nr:carboxyl transferase domain-containing protein [Chlorobaculum parvum]ACF11245.1 acetyl-CoA carboxylase alpha subunit-like protein [Chlorobaculum parvum NCIB 8327]
MKHFFLPFEKTNGFSYSAKSIERLSEYEKYQLSFHPERPKYLDYLAVFDNVEECLANDLHGSRLIQTHRADLHRSGKAWPVMLIGQQSGPTSDFVELTRIMQDQDEMRRWNQGMPTPAAFDKAIEAIDIAEREGRTIITVIDTAGADPTEESEAGGIAWKIGRCMQALAEATVPTISVIINRGCSGGAIALTGCDAVLAMEYSTYLVISPEACSSILFRTRDKANLAAEISQITSKEGFSNGIVDELIGEPAGPAHRFPAEALESFREVVGRRIEAFGKAPLDSLQQRRIERWEKIGEWNETTEEAITAYEKPVSCFIPAPKKGLFIKRHKHCRNEHKREIIDPVLYKKLLADNFICDTCGVRYTRLSAHDYIGLLLDCGSFAKHPETRYIIDRDILEFPDYADKLREERVKNGITTALITGDGTVDGREVVLCATSFGFLGGSFCMSTGEKVWRAAKIAIEKRRPLIIQAAGGGARMHEGCSSMVSIPKIHLALSLVEQAGLPLITIVTDPTLGGVAIGFGSRGIRIFEHNAGNIGFSGKRVIEQYTGKKTSKEFQTTGWLQSKGYVDMVAHPLELKSRIAGIIDNWTQR